MAEITLHFEAEPGTDLKAATAALQQNISQVAGVETADTRAQRFQGVTGQEIISVIQVATAVAGSAATLLGSLAALYTAWLKLKALFPGLKTPTVEVGLKQVPIDQLKPEHAEEIASGS